MCSRCQPACCICAVQSRWCGASGGWRSSSSSWAKPSIAFSGVRSSWLMRDRNSLFARLAASAAARQRSASCSFRCSVMSSTTPTRRCGRPVGVAQHAETIDCTQTMPAVLAHVALAGAGHRQSRRARSLPASSVSAARSSGCVRSRRDHGLQLFGAVAEQVAKARVGSRGCARAGRCRRRRSAHGRGCCAGAARSRAAPPRCGARSSISRCSSAVRSRHRRSMRRARPVIVSSSAPSIARGEPGRRAKRARRSSAPRRARAPPVPRLGASSAGRRSRCALACARSPAAAGASQPVGAGQQRGAARRGRRRAGTAAGMRADPVVGHAKAGLPCAASANTTPRKAGVALRLVAWLAVVNGRGR